MEKRKGKKKGDIYIMGLYSIHSLYIEIYIYTYKTII